MRLIHSGHLECLVTLQEFETVVEGWMNQRKFLQVAQNCLWATEPSSLVSNCCNKDNGGKFKHSWCETKTTVPPFRELKTSTSIFPQGANSRQVHHLSVRKSGGWDWRVMRIIYIEVARLYRLHSANLAEMFPCLEMGRGFVLRVWDRSGEMGPPITCQFVGEGQSFFPPTFLPSFLACRNWRLFMVVC